MLLTRLGDELAILRGTGSGSAIYDGEDPAGSLHRVLGQLQLQPVPR